MLEMFKLKKEDLDINNDLDMGVLMLMANKEMKEQRRRVKLLSYSLFDLM